MSQENVDLVCAGYTALERGDMATVLDLIDEKILITGRVAPDVQPAQGREGLLANLANARAGFDELSFEPIEVTDLGERVLVHVRVCGKGRGGIEAQSDIRPDMDLSRSQGGAP